MTHLLYLMKDGDDDVDVREIGSKDNVDNVTDEGLGHDKICVDVLDRNICMRCYEGGEILVCSEIGCPVVVHAKCIGCEPRFDDMGKYYCPYCWLKRTLVEVQVLRNKALTAKKDLADFLDGNVTASDELGEKCGEEKRRDSDDEVSLAKNGSCLDDRSKQGNGCERTEPLQRVEDQQDEMEDVMADVDQHGKVIEDDTHEKAREADSDDPMHHGEENLSEHIDLTDKPRTNEKAGVRKITGAHKTTFIDGKKGVEPEHPRSSDENIDEGVPEDEAVASPSSSGHLGEQKDGLSPDIASVKKKPESTAARADNKDARQGREESLQKESKMPSVSTSLSETNDSNSEAPLVKKRRIKHTAQKRPQRVNNAQGEDGCHEEEEVTSSETSRQVRKSSKQG